MKNSKLKPLHPGVFVKETFKSESGLNLSTKSIANLLKISEPTVQNLINGKSGITLNLAAKLSFVTKTSIEMWLNMQQSWNIHKFEKQRSLITKELKPLTRKQLPNLKTKLYD